MELLLIRHALPVRQVVTEGTADPHLAPEGVEQAARLADYLEDDRIDALYASTLRRALETAEPLAEVLGLDIAVEPDVAEWDREQSSYIPIEELRARKDELWQALAEGRLHDLGIDVDHFVERVTGAFARIAAAHPGERVAVICHGGVINTYCASVLGLERVLFFQPDYTSISRVLVARDGRSAIQSLNETPHLPRPSG